MFSSANVAWYLIEYNYTTSVAEAMKNLNHVHVDFNMRINREIQKRMPVSKNPNLILIAKEHWKRIVIYGL